MGNPDPTSTRSVRVPPPAEPDGYHSGTAWQRMLADSCELLHRHVDALNAINVFPVPDGDTGTNMYLTLRAGVDAVAQLKDAVGTDTPVLRVLSQGALMGARGNSGVILSQVLHGLAGALGGTPSVSGNAVTEALAAASGAAYAALSQPREGTILTAVREAAEALEREAPATLPEALSAAARAAFKAVERTPDLLPQLKEAGVVDAGALGFAIILEGLRRSLSSESLDVDLAPEYAERTANWRDEAVSPHRAEHGESGYCTEFLTSSSKVSQSVLREELEPLGSSLLVVGDEDLIRVHIHTDRPDDVLAVGRRIGSIEQTKVDNLEQQIDQFAASARASLNPSIDIVTVAAGSGMERVFRGIGATRVVSGGQSMNPSAGEILEAIISCESDTIVVLPNNKNIVAAARQAAEQSRKTVEVIPSVTVPQGIAAALAMADERSVTENLDAMRAALNSVRSAEVTRAVRETAVGGRRVEIGQAIAIVDGEMSVVSDSLEQAVEDSVIAMGPEAASLLTVYYGEDVRKDDAEALVAILRKSFTYLDVELVHGGQPHYPYLLSLE